MKVTTAALTALVSMLAVANGFVISVCGSSKNYKLGDNHCQDWTDSTFTYQSNVKCTMIFYRGSGCSGDTWSSNVQDQCHTLPWKPQHMNCAKT